MKAEDVLLDRLPGFSLEAPVDRLGDGGLHQVHIAHHQRGVQVLQVLMELSVAQVVFGKEREKRERFYGFILFNLDLTRKVH